ncbi:MAG: folylpolyglutamate synthase/dihydrofolate synthase family protein [candidate division WOR-3 bacterium]
MDFKTAEQFLTSLINYERTALTYNELKLERFRKLLRDLDNPERKLKNVILVAGTKGKGSVCHFLESALQHCELKTGHFTKPHLLSVCERIKVASQPIAQSDFARILTKIRPLVKKHNATYFETITATAFLYFLENNLDYTILEVGLGGRLDATNVTQPIIAVITLIGFDHIETLGNSLKKIATEKAGIIRNNSYVVCSKQRPMACNIIKEKVLKTNSQLCLIGRDLKITNEKLTETSSHFTIQFNNTRSDFTIPVIGRHQIANAATAIGVLKRLNELDNRIRWDKVKQGLKAVKIPGRCQIVQRYPIVMVDVAHNPDSAQALSETVQEIFKKDVILIFGASKDKLVNEMLKILLPITKKLILTKADSPRACLPKELVKIVEPYSIPYIVTESVKKAIGEGLRKVAPDEMVVITGSFYVAGEALRHLKTRI